MLLWGTLSDFLHLSAYKSPQLLYLPYSREKAINTQRGSDHLARKVHVEQGGIQTEAAQWGNNVDRCYLKQIRTQADKLYLLK